MRKEGRRGTILAPVHRRSKVAQKDLGDDCVCGLRSRMVPTGLGCETCEDAGQEVRRSMGWLWPTSNWPSADLWYTIQYLTFPVSGSEGSGVMPLVSVARFRHGHRPQLCSGPVSDTRTPEIATKKLKCHVHRLPLKQFPIFIVVCTPRYAIVMPIY